MDKTNTGILRLILENLKRTVLEIADSLCRKYHAANEGLEWRIDNVKTKEFRNLAPTDEIENGEEYFRALDWALKDKAITNVALSGPYGSGKSSIIKSYLIKHPSIKALNLSLATFKETDIKDENLTEFEAAKQKEQQIEAGILKQLFYKVNCNKIPQSRYRKLQKVKTSIIYANLLILLILSSIVVTFFAKDTTVEIYHYIAKAGSEFGLKGNQSVLVSVIFCLVILWIISWAVRWLATTWKIIEINISNKATFSRKDDNEKSIFNKNMDEIVYFFETTNYDTVFIEDMDRFENTEIFIKLRELNTILNNYEMIKRRIVFVYAIKDDMFSDTERTKFFDFIIPVVPYINSTNSNELLKKILGDLESETNREYKISEKFITLVSPYISDMRVLISICNEFVIYKETLGTNQNLEELDDEKILAMMIFKNLYPKEFSKLEAEEGIVKTAFNNKESFINAKIEEISHEKKSLEDILENIESEILVDIRELKAAFLFQLSKEQGIVKSINVEGKTYDLSTIMRDEFDMELLASSSLYIPYVKATGGSDVYTLKNVDENFKKNGRGYISRWKDLRYSSEERKEEIRKRIENKNKEQFELKAQTMFKLIETYTAEKVLDATVFKNKLLVFLLRNGYIDETYSNYINYFHPNSITDKEQNFIINIRNHGGSNNYEYPIINTEKVIDRLLEFEFRQKEILNFNILDALLNERPVGPKCVTLLQQLSDRTDASNDFIKQYLARGEHIRPFIRELSKYHDWLWNDLEEDYTIPQKTKNMYLAYILKWAELQDIERQNIVNKYHPNKIRVRIEEEMEIWDELNDFVSDRIFSIFSTLEPKFYQLPTDKVSTRILEIIFENNFYEINGDMLRVFVCHKAKDKLEQLEKAHYTTLLEIGYPPVIQYVEGRIQDYVKIILNINTNIDESVDSIQRIMNLLNYEPSLCKQLIEKEVFAIEDIATFIDASLLQQSKIPENIILIVDKMFEKWKVVANWKNVIWYRNLFGTSLKWIRFIEEHMEAMVKAEDVHLVTNELIMDILSKTMSIKSYKLFLKKFRIDNFEGELSSYTSEQIKAMIEERYFLFSPERFLEIKNFFPELIMVIILLNRRIFFDKIQEYNIELEEVEQLLDVPQLSTNEKYKLILYVNSENITMKMAAWICDIQLPFGKEYIIAAWALLQEQDRFELLKNHIQVFKKEDFPKLFIELPKEYHALADRTRAHKVSLYKNDANVVIMNYLYKIGYLSSITEEESVQTNMVTFEEIRVPKIAGRVRKDK